VNKSSAKNLRAEKSKLLGKVQISVCC